MISKQHKMIGCSLGGRLSSSSNQCGLNRTCLKYSFPLKIPWYHRFLLGFILLVSILSKAEANMKKPLNEYDVVEGIVGDRAVLRCKPSKPVKRENPILVLWYKDGARIPFFTLDLRVGDPQEFFDKAMKERVNSDVTGEFLTLRKLILSDTSFYKCKVNYDNSPSLEAEVYLKVYKPPHRLSIQNEDGQTIVSGKVEPLMQDSYLSLTCTAFGANPPAEISWWRGNDLVNDHYKIESMDNSIVQNYQKTKSVYKIAKLGRSHHNANITCRALNNNISAPLEKTITLVVYLRPQTVELIKPPKYLRENVSANFRCETTGSFPPAQLTWYINKNNGQPIAVEAQQTYTTKELKTVSRLKFIPGYKNHGSTLTCKAQNMELASKGSVHNSTVLEVRFAPRVKLKLGKNLAHRSIREGEDVYFDCEIDSNPRKKTIVWKRNGVPVEQDLKAGILLSGENLVLQRINRSYAGNYTCAASNELGNRTSDPVPLPVMFLPVCRTNLTQVFAVGEEEGVKLECKVNALPTKNLTFIWLFNNTLDTVEVQRERIKSDGPVSYIDYSPLSTRDYGTLSCWATNEVGMQASPCVFIVTEAGPPDRVKNCVLVNHTNHTVGSLEVRCSPGNDGGSPQRFLAKVFAAGNSDTLLAELNSKVPKFHVSGLTPGQDYLVTITSLNEKGVSDPVEIDAIRLKVAEKRMGDVSSPPISPLVGAFLGLVGGFLLLLLIGLLLSRARSNSRSSCWSHKRGSGADVAGRYAEAINSSEQNHLSSHLHTRISPSQFNRPIQDDEEDSPDLVKSSNETSQLLNTKKNTDTITRRHTYISSPENVPSPILSESSHKGVTDSLNPFLDSQSPVHLPSDESFV